MSLHYLDPEREPRECDVCRPNGIPNPYIYGSSGCVVSDCTRCYGTGRLGVEPDDRDAHYFWPKVRNPTCPWGWCHQCGEARVNCCCYEDSDEVDE